VCVFPKNIWFSHRKDSRGFSSNADINCLNILALSWFAIFAQVQLTGSGIQNTDHMKLETKRLSNEIPYMQYSKYITVTITQTVVNIAEILSSYLTINNNQSI
jgi:hypothetical protein